MRDSEMEKNSAGQMKPAEPARAPQPAPEKTPAEMQSNIDGIVDRSLDRQKARGAAERKAAEDRSGKKASILNVVRAAPKQLPSLTAHWVWTAMGTSGITPRPRSEDEFRELIFEIIRAGSLALVSGNPQSPTTKIYIKIQTFRID